MAFKFVAFAAVLAVAQAGVAPVAYSAPLAHAAYAAPVAHAAYAAPVAHAAYAAPVAHAYAAPIAKVAAPVAYAAKAVVPEPYDPNPQYQYGYGINDHLTGDNKNAQEVRNGDAVQGSYSLIDADGFKRTVEYTADPIHGFNAVVHREPLAVKAVAPVVAKVAAPVAYAAAPAVYHH